MSAGQDAKHKQWRVSPDVSFQFLPGFSEGAKFPQMESRRRHSWAQISQKSPRKSFKGVVTIVRKVFRKRQRTIYVVLYGDKHKLLK